MYNCKRCGYNWENRKTTPKACPRCKSYLWCKEKKTEKGETNEQENKPTNQDRYDGQQEFPEQ